MGTARKRYPPWVAHYRDHAVVLRTYRLGEADRIVVLFTRDRGKIRSVAKGVRRSKSKFGARLEPGSFVAVQMYEGRNLDTVTQAETVESFHEIRDDLDRLTTAAAILEAVDLVAQEGKPDQRLFDMTVGALRTVRDRPGPVVLPAFLFRVLAHDGVAPEVQVCVGCGEEAELVAIDLAHGGAQCRSCQTGPALSAGALELLRAVLGGSLAAAMSCDDQGAITEVRHRAQAAFEAHVEKHLRASSVI